MKKDLALVKPSDVADWATERIATDLVPMAVELLKDMLRHETKSHMSEKVSNADLSPKARNKKLYATAPVTYGRYHLELVKLTLASVGIGKQAPGNAKDPAKMTAQELLAEIDRRRKIIDHEPAKPLSVLD